MPVLRTCRWCCGMSDFKQTTNQRDGSFGCSKAVFYVFVFDSIHDSATMHNLSPEIFHWTKKDACTFLGAFGGNGKNVYICIIIN